MTVREAMEARAEKRKAAARKAKQTAMASARKAKQTAMASARALKPEQPFDEAAAKAEFAALDRLALTVWMNGGQNERKKHRG